MDVAMKIAVVLTAFDKMTDVVDKASNKAEERLKKLMGKSFAEGGAMIATGVGLINKFVAPTVEAYSKLEVANADLQASMMDSTKAIDKNFEGISNLAETLGDELPGTTADFYNLFQVMMQNGVKSESILHDVGRAASYLAVDLKMPYEAAGQFAARMKEATGVADEEMLKFMDTISKANSLGIGASEMQYAFSRSAGTLKMLGLQGLKASNDMTVLYASLIRAGMSGETAATSFNNIIQNVLDPKKFGKFKDLGKSLGLNFQIFDKEGKFLGVENMVAQFDQMKDLSTTKKAALVQALTGGGADGQALNSIITGGVAGYRKMRTEMEAKAKLNDKINVKLATLASLWESTTGTIENMLAALGKGLSPVLKPIVDMIGRIAGQLKVWFSENPRLAKFIMMVASLMGIFLTLLGAIKIIQGIRIAMQLLNLTMKDNPFLLFASIAILVIGYIYSNWDKIKAWFSKLWESIKNIFMAVWNWIKKNLIYVFAPQLLLFKYWDKLKPFFSKIWDYVANIFKNFWEWLKKAGKFIWDIITWPYVTVWKWINKFVNGFYNAGKSIVMNIWKGIKDFFNHPIEKVKEMVGKIRNLLPFSPAKTGPLRDIHRIRLVETIADSIKPNPLVNKMRNVAKMTFDVMAGKPGQQLSPISAKSNSGSGPITINVSVTGGATQQDAKRVTDELKKAFPQLMKQYQGQQSRVALG